MTRRLHIIALALTSASLLSNVSQAGTNSSAHQYQQAGEGSFNSGASFGFNASFNGGARANANNRMASSHGTQKTKQAWIIRGVNFKYDSAELTPDSLQSLNNVATTLLSNSGPILEVGGHASAEGDDAYNLDLSARRAKSVRNYLVARGINAQRLTSRGYGEAQPLVKNTTESGRSVNRRVELSPSP